MQERHINNYKLEMFKVNLSLLYAAPSSCNPRVTLPAPVPRQFRSELCGCTSKQDSVVGIASSCGGSGFESRGGANFFPFCRIFQTGSGAHLASFSTYIVFFSYWKSSRGVKLTTHLRLVRRLRMSGAILLLPLYAIMVSTETTLFLKVELSL